MDKVSVLIVDDEKDARSALSRCLAPEDYVLHFASGGAEALELLA